MATSASRRLLDPVRRRAKQRIERLVDRRLRSALTAERAELEGKLEVALAAQARALEEAMYTNDYLLGKGRRGDRVLQPARLTQLQEEIKAVTGETRIEGVVRQTFRSLLELESRGIGRIAGSTWNILGKLTTTPLLAPPPGPVLEIGTLYGVFAGGLMRQFARFGDERHLTMLDPLAGVQLQPGKRILDDPSGSPVVAEVVRSNLHLAGLDDAAYRLVQGYSNDADTKQIAGDRSYSVVIVDGDHSHEGVHHDVTWAAEICAEGAIVVLDDFGDGGWAGVRTGYEQAAAEGAPFDFLGTVSTSAYLRHRPR